MIKRDDIPLGYTYDDDGNPITYKRSNGYWEECTRDAKGNFLTSKNSDGFWRERTYDANGNELTYKSGQIDPDVEPSPTESNLLTSIQDLLDHSLTDGLGVINKADGEPTALILYPEAVKAMSIQEAHDLISAGRLFRFDEQV